MMFINLQEKLYSEIPKIKEVELLINQIQTTHQ